ncbi:MAG: 4-hydroxythreonine-4-phosphate dehydrogenase PdxA [Gemmatimonadales bacterium]
MTAPARLALTLGDPRGIGPEVAARALAAKPRLNAIVTVIGAEDQIELVPAQERIGVGQWRSGSGQGADRMRSVRAGQLAGHAIQRAVRMAMARQVDGIVTGPVEKHALHSAGFPFPGQTEWLGQLAGARDVAMMLVAGNLRVVLVTTHAALRDVPSLITFDRVVRIGLVTRRGLGEWFGLDNPRIALCALNPHAGEQGLFGDEEARVLIPAAKELRASGPFPADTVFVRAMKGDFDAVLAPYHDVGMTAVKVAAFGKGVNVTLGLPFPRTSPDHGTAFDIAGRDRADPQSMRAALELAAQLATRRPIFPPVSEGKGVAP